MAGTNYLADRLRKLATLGDSETRIQAAEKLESLEETVALVCRERDAARFQLVELRTALLRARRPLGALLEVLNEMPDGAESSK
jgi:hypothetical protein